MADSPKQVLSRTSINACQRALAACNDVLPALERLEEIAAVYPPILERVQDLRARQEYLRAAAETALGMDRTLSDGMS